MLILIVYVLSEARGVNLNWRIRKRELLRAESAPS
jgi:hypothetical protein